MDIVFVSPPDYPYSGFPIGIATLAAILRQNGFSVAIVDASPRKLDQQQTFEKIQALDPRIVGLSGMVHSSAFLRDIASLAYAMPRRPHILAGGWWAMPNPEFILRNTQVDYVVRDEADNIIVPLVQALFAGEDPSSLPDVCSLSPDGLYRQGLSAPLPRQLDDIPFPAYDLCDMEYYSPVIPVEEMLLPPYVMKRLNGRKTFKYATMFSGRGCYGKCDFCSAANVLRRNNSPKYIVDNMELLATQYNVDFFFFGESLTLTTRKWVTEFCNELLSRSFKCNYIVTSRVDFKYDDDVLDLLSKSGCVSSGVGFESGSDDMLAMMHKKVKVATARQMTKDMKRHGIGIGGSFILNMPGETLATSRETLEFVREISSDAGYLGFGYAYPYPGTSLFRYAMDRGFCSTEEFYFTNDNKRIHSRAEFDAYFAKFDFNNLDRAEMFRIHEELGALINSHNIAFTFSSLSRPAQAALLGRVMVKKALVKLGLIQVARRVRKQCASILG
jgi:radical SAM superfamily enzyme YgiQ (UPF0313 family)